MLLYSGFRHRVNYEMGPKCRWMCTKSRCKGALFTYNDKLIRIAGFEYITSRAGNTMILKNGYKYSLQLRNRERCRWYCSSHHHKGCRANIHTIYDEIIMINEVHNFEYITSKAGRQLILKNGYTYSLQTRKRDRCRWYCSSHHNRGCRANIHTIYEQIVAINEVHSHLRK
ncbi:hypothetical protein B5X24_HaOG203959 [Helicoverpa armigera]|uniref:FLYWCH-type domain-containing protein n=1 Tax=Helicoverpa armigera TaxID=29058 RepID=A0A2W1BPU6_HELAM|nr:hypothetical protein B5X24_HaOG203959 [Helicoverpa armigera]